MNDRVRMATAAPHSQESTSTRRLERLGVTAGRAPSEAWPPIEHDTLILATPAEVFRAVATAEGIDAWLSDETTLEPWVGGRIRLCRARSRAETTADDFGIVLAYERNHRLSFSWPNASRPTVVTIGLHAQGPGTRIHITEVGFPRTEEDLRVLLRCAASWGEALTLLKWHLEG